MMRDEFFIYRYSFTDLPVKHLAIKRKETTIVNDSTVMDTFSKEAKSPHWKKRKINTSYTPERTQFSDAENRFQVNAANPVSTCGLQQLNCENQNSCKVADTALTRQQNFGNTGCPKFDMMNNIQSESISQASCQAYRRRGALEPRDLNVDYSRGMACQESGSVKCDSSMNSPVQKSEGAKVLRSTSQRRQSSLSHSSSSSPTVVTPSNTIYTNQIINRSSPVSRPMKTNTNRQNWPRRLLGLNARNSSTSHISETQDLKTTQSQYLLQQTFNSESASLPMETNRETDELKTLHRLNNDWLNAMEDSNVSCNTRKVMKDNEFVGTEGYCSTPYTDFTLAEATTKSKLKKSIDERSGPNVSSIEIEKHFDDIKAVSPEKASKNSNSYLDLSPLSSNVLEISADIDETGVDAFGDSANYHSFSQAGISRRPNNLDTCNSEDGTTSDHLCVQKPKHSLVASDLRTLQSHKMTLNPADAPNDAQNYKTQISKDFSHDNSPSLPKYVFRKVYGTSGSSWAIHVVGES